MAALAGNQRLLDCVDPAAQGGVRALGGSNMPSAEIQRASQGLSVIVEGFIGVLRQVSRGAIRPRKRRQGHGQGAAGNKRRSDAEQQAGEGLLEAGGEGESKGAGCS
ncbi:MAG: hypothetical protein WDO68_20255 [Gammaproteobacteria bacterium]